MKSLRLFFLISVLSALFCVSCDQFENLKEYNFETVYPGRFDKITYMIGFERVEIDLMNAGRIWAKDMNLGKAVRTVYEYDGKVFELDSLYSWVNVTGLSEKKLYRIQVYTMDDYKNKSIPFSIAVVPYTSIDRDLLVVPTPKAVMKADGTVTITWPVGINTPMADFVELAYTYTDIDGPKTGVLTGNSPRLEMKMELGKSHTIGLTYKLRPILSGTTTRIIDTVSLYLPLVLDKDMPITP